MPISKAMVSRIRVLAITHILVGALLIIFGIANSVTTNSYDDIFNSNFGLFGIGAGTWMCIAGALGIPASTPQRTQRRNCFAGIFMGFAITSAVLGGIIIILYSMAIGAVSCQYYCDLRDGYSYDNFTFPPSFTGKPRYSYETKMGLASVILTLGIIEFGTGIWVSICLCVMKPCCIDIEEREPLANSVTG
ncbi:uncharacterized protein LOC114977047 [Acropora millepora]|uniref:uncharacterized protein LOC114977047 n=1 Tax=Acropora millepora TaxID=45264 RepID=UPI001CF2C319|nr:uncharacterized protein LOC114977047 [Acropora millepora]